MTFSKIQYNMGNAIDIDLGIDYRVYIGIDIDQKIVSYCLMCLLSKNRSKVMESLGDNNHFALISCKKSL